MVTLNSGDLLSKSTKRTFTRNWSSSISTYWFNHKILRSPESSEFWETRWLLSNVRNVWLKKKWNKSSPQIYPERLHYRQWREDKEQMPSCFLSRYSQSSLGDEISVYKGDHDWQYYMVNMWGLCEMDNI